MDDAPRRNHSFQMYERNALRAAGRGAAAGIVATAVAGASDRALRPLVSERQKALDQALREGSPHEVAGPRFGERLLGRDLSATERLRAQRAFSLAYGVGWGLVHAFVRRRFPAARRYMGLPLAAPFFLLCDGAIAPLLGLTPGLRRIPWQMSLKELANHTSWTVASEAVQRVARR